MRKKSNKKFNGNNKFCLVLILLLIRIEVTVGLNWLVRNSDARLRKAAGGTQPSFNRFTIKCSIDVDFIAEPIWQSLPFWLATIAANKKNGNSIFWTFREVFFSRAMELAADYQILRLFNSNWIAKLKDPFSILLISTINAHEEFIFCSRWTQWILVLNADQIWQITIKKTAFEERVLRIGKYSTWQIRFSSIFEIKLSAINKWTRVFIIHDLDEEKKSKYKTLHNNNVKKISQKHCC